MKHDYYSSKMIKMGEWALYPLDSCTWHTFDTTVYFNKLLGFYKGTLALHDIKKELQYCYFPQYHFDRLFKWIDKTNEKDYRGLEKKLLKFYDYKAKAKKEIPKFSAKDYSKLSNKEIIKLYKKNRDWVHMITVYDQFGWTAEDYWTKPMENILVNKLGLEKNSPEYNRVLFALTKPEEISTTLEEKRAVLAEVIKIKEQKRDKKAAARLLAKKYGWMPVFTFGEPWKEEYYLTHLQEVGRKSLASLKKEYQGLKKYSQNRNQDILAMVQKYNISKRDLQVFIDFGLALDARNEAEYIVSFASSYVMPMYKEMAKRLHISFKQLRHLVETEIISCLEGRTDVHEILSNQGQCIGWGFNHRMDKMFNFSPQEAEEMLNFLEKDQIEVYGQDDGQGKCANSGKVRGKARIVLSPRENDKVENGDIMICCATTVDYLPAMKKAAAFVTEVGGLTCHAAVVSREFGVPCIVSYKEATKKFKDGDLIEVDADKGIIKKVK